MQVRIFNVPLHDADRGCEELNKFLAAHRVIDVTQTVTHEGCWSFCVKYLNKGVPESGSSDIYGLNSSVKKKVDYKEILNDSEFRRFSLLRAARKQISTAESIPAYAVFTDAELAAFSKMEELTSAAMKNVDGVGKGKMESFGERVLNIYNELAQGSQEEPSAHTVQ